MLGNLVLMALFALFLLASLACTPHVDHSGACHSAPGAHWGRFADARESKFPRSELLSSNVLADACGSANMR